MWNLKSFLLATTQFLVPIKWTTVLLASPCTRIAVTASLAFVSYNNNKHQASMGRVAKYKKIKSCDPFSSKNGGTQSMTDVWGMGDDGRRPKKRSKTSIALRKKRKRPVPNDEFDVPPTGGDDFDLNDLLVVKKIKPAANELLDEKPKKMTTEKTVVPSVPVANHNGSDSDDLKTREIVPDPMLEEKRAARILKIEPQQDAHKKKKAHKVERFPGESRKAFQKRCKSETRRLIKNEKLQEHNPEKRQRKKEFLNKKKKAKKASRQNEDSHDDDYDYQLQRNQRNQESSNDGFITGEQAVARAALGDQVERPPVFLQLPRGAKAKMTAKKQDGKGRGVSIEMENMRRKVQAQYALVKAKRRKEGDFHL